MTKTSLRRRFLRDERGAATIEALIWTPVIFTFLILIADVSMIFNGQARLLRIVQDANRSLSVGRLADEQAAMQQIRDRVAGMTKTPEVSTTITNGVIFTRLTVPTSSLDIVGWFAPLISAKITVTSEHFKEY